MRSLVLFAAALATPLFADGVDPRHTPGDYPAMAAAGDHAIWAAAVVPPDEVRRLLVTDLRKWMVIEVAVYPAPQTRAQVPAKPCVLIALRDELRTTLEPATPAAVADAIQRASQKRTDEIRVHPTAGVGKETTRDVDPLADQQAKTRGSRLGNQRAQGGVRIDFSGKEAPPPLTAKDREVMEAELSDHALKESEPRFATAGYLYFPALPGKVRPGGYELVCGAMTLPLTEAQ